eukprot:scaffold5744_cov179-Ochromonas_danica.AAC.5
MAIEKQSFPLMSSLVSIHSQKLEFLQTKEPKTSKGEAFITEPWWIVRPRRKTCELALTGVQHTDIVFKLSPPPVKCLIVKSSQTWAALYSEGTGELFFMEWPKNRQAGR